MAMSSPATASRPRSKITPGSRSILGRAYRISSIKVVPRGDGHLDELVPSVLEVSDNGTEFTEVSRRTDEYSQSKPWSLSAKTKARFVRVRVLRQAVLALSELEVHGRP